MRISGIFFPSLIALALGRPLLHSGPHGIDDAGYIEGDQASLGVVKIVTDRRVVQEHPLLERRGLGRFMRNHVNRPLKKWWHKVTGKGKIILVTERDAPYVFLEKGGLVYYGCREKGASKHSTAPDQPQDPSPHVPPGESEAICEEGAEAPDTPTEGTRKPDDDTSLNACSNQFVDSIIDNVRNVGINGATRVNAAALALQRVKGSPGSFQGLPSSFKHPPAVIP